MNAQQAARLAYKGHTLALRKALDENPTPRFVLEVVDHLANLIGNADTALRVLMRQIR